MPGPRGSDKVASDGVESLLPLFHEMKKFHEFEMSRLTSYLGSESCVYLPVCCLRWTHDRINSQMVFGSGRREDGSIYELVHDLHSGRVAPESIEPLLVVLDGQKLYSLTNRRLAALKMFQALHQHEMVRVPCKIYHAQDARINAKYKSAKSTSGSLCDGLGLLSCGPEAWHMGSPIFRSSQEWCERTCPENLELQPITPLEGAAASQESWQAAACQPPTTLKPSYAVQADAEQRAAQQDGCSAAPSRNSTEFPEEGSKIVHSVNTSLKVGMQLQVHSSGKLYLAEVIQISQIFKRCEVAAVKVHYVGYPSDADEWVGLDRVQSEVWKAKSSQPTPPSETRTSCQRHVESQPNRGLPVSPNTGSQDILISLAPTINFNESMLDSTSQTPLGPSDALSTFAAGVQPGQASTGPISCSISESQETSSTSLGSAYSLLTVGMQLQVLSSGKLYLAEVIQISQIFKRGEVAAIKVHYVGYPSDAVEWVGLDRVRSKPTPLSETQTSCQRHVESQPNRGLPVSPNTGSQDISISLAPTINFDESMLDSTSQAPLGPSDALSTFAAGVQPGQASTGPISCSISESQETSSTSLDSAYSLLTVGMQLQVKGKGCAEVKEISQAKERAEAPIKVHYLGHDSSSDEWVDLNRLQSKVLKKTLSNPITLAGARESQDKKVCSTDEHAEQESAAASSVICKAGNTGGTNCGVDGAGNKKHAGAQRHTSGFEPDCSDAEDDSEEEEEEDDPERSLQGDGASGSSEYENIADLERELEKNSGIKTLRKLEETLVCGTFKVSSGQDAKNRRCRGEMVVERGPEPMLGCRVHIVGRINRNFAWDFDRCWVRIVLARIARVPGESGPVSSSWDAHAAERTTLYGRVVRAEEYGIPRQMRVVGLRSKVVRSLTSLNFRAVNGKFPMIRVPWDSAKELPSAFDLYIIDIVLWKGLQLPQGRIVEKLEMQKRSSTESIMHAVQVSLNFCDWDANPADDLIRMPNLHADVKSFESDALVVAFEEPGLPVSMAFSIPQGRECVHVHIIDVNEYFDMPGFEKVEEVIRRRSVGFWPTDYLDRPLDASLPLLPAGLEKTLGFQSCSRRDVLTFSFSMTGGHTKAPKSAKHFQNIVHCNKVLTFEEVGEVLADSQRQDDVSKLVRSLFRHILTIENTAKKNYESTLIEHFEPDFGSGHSLPTIKDKQVFHRVASRLVAGYTYLVNQYAGSVLKDPQAWAPILKSGMDSTVQASKSQFELPALVHGKPDPIIHNVLDRLMQRREFTGNSTVRVKDMIEASTSFLRKPGLNFRQKYVLHSAFIRRARTAMPNAFYKLVDTRPCASKANHMDSGDLFQREGIFQVCQPLRRYIDILGLRALKCKLGWTPRNLQLSMTPGSLAETLARTNARQDAQRFASYIFRQITLMNQVAKAGWQIEGAVIGPVGPVHFDVLIPQLVSNVVEMRVPVSALRSASCMVQYSPEKQMLDVVCTNTKESSLSPYDRASWSIKPWSANDLSCVVARNFAHAVPNHASGSAVIASDITFLAAIGSRKVQVTLGLGHRMYPEMFSSLPDLDKWHLIDRDAMTYSHIWSNIKECQIHASAASSPSYTPPVPALRLTWSSAEGKGCYKCFVESAWAAFADCWIAKGDLAILRCTFERKAAVLHGLVKRVSPKPVVLSKLPSNTNGRNAVEGAPACHEKDGQKEVFVFEVEVSLSEVSESARAQQCQLWEKASEVSDCCTLQFINVQPTEKKILELVHAVPKTISASPSSPIAKYLTLLQTPHQKRRELETKPLASIRQVESAMQQPHFRMKGGSALNEQQLDGIKRGLQRPLSLVQGPPGTGKTTFLVHLIVALLNLEADGTMGASDHKRNGQKGKRQPQKRPGKILICTPSNHAADEIIERVLQKTDIPHHYITRVYARSIESGHGCKYRGGSQWNTNSDLKFNIRAGLEEHSLHFKTQSLRDVRPLHDALPTHAYDSVAQRSFDEAYSRGEPEVLRRSRVVITTCSSALLHTALNKFNGGSVWRPISFESVVIDEAAQASEPDVVLPALLAESRVVIVGDHKQLGPVVPEKNLCKAYVQALETPFVERVLEASSRRAPTSTKLNVQYRMHSSIRSFPSKQFYGSSLEDASTMTSQPLLQCIWPNTKEHVVFLDCRHPHSYGLRVEDGRRYSNATTLIENNTSLKNSGEVKLVVEAYDRLLKYGTCTANEIAIITPYRSQQQEIQEKLQQRVGDVAKKTVVGTVHALQGSERDYVIISFVRSTSEEMQNNSLASPDDVVHSVNKNSLNLRQLCESNLGIVSNEKLLNVSLTRAKHGLICIGNREVLSQASKDFFDLSEHYAAAGCVLTYQKFMSLGLPKEGRSHGKKGYRVSGR